MTVLLYVPGSRPDRFDKAADTGATVVLDLEDAVAPADKDDARTAVTAWLSGNPSIAAQVRVNAPGSSDFEADLAALPSDVDLRVPKVEHPADLEQLAGRRVHALIESALGVERAFEIASTAGVSTIGLGEADLGAELGLPASDAAFAWIRSRVVVAARAAGLPPPLMSVYAAVADLDGLAASCLAGRHLGMWGRAAVHPTQVPVIRDAFSPTDAERAWAQEVLAALADTGVARLADGSMVDAAMARRARALLGAG